jgi:hypothetical protein
MILAKERLKVSARPWDLGSEDGICYTGIKKQRKRREDAFRALLTSYMRRGVCLLGNGALTESTEKVASENNVKGPPKCNDEQLCCPSAADESDKRMTQSKARNSITTIMWERGGDN